VAAATGGLATSICQADYTPALDRLGLQAAAPRSSFPLSRTPLTPVSAALEVRVGGGVLPSSSSTWWYLGCPAGSSGSSSAQVAANAIQFAPSSTPLPGVTLQVSYFVNVHPTPCP
jgi:hypothetical protein